jgi:hypothetical protein
MPDSESTSAVKYVLYTHYWQGQDDDFKAYQQDPRPETLTGIAELLAHMPGLRQLLTAPGHEGMAVIFYAPGYRRFLEAIAHSENIDELLRRDDADTLELRFARDVSVYVKTKLNELGLGARVRFLTPLDLRVILGRVNAIFASKFVTFFLGVNTGLRYDAPKVVEAILRLRLLGMGVPVLRLDHDVIFRGKDNKDIGDLGLFKAVTCAVRAYRLRLEQTAISTFLFSGSYDCNALLQRPNRDEAFDAWSGAFATRVFPALIADPQKIRETCEKKDQALWRKYIDEHLDEDLACRYYGLKPIVGKLEADDLNGLISVGAHPLHAVISGALLCLSDGAILDLPPFSNFTDNVMWIDDHLKYSLHRAMKHLRRSEELVRMSPGLADSRLDEVRVTKARPFIKDLPSYVFGVYLPTLLFGTIMDVWITADSLVKCRRDSLLTDAERAEWRTARDAQGNEPLPTAMLAALSVGEFKDDAAIELRAALTAKALERIEQVRQLWANLANENGRSFASYWVEGNVRSIFGAQCFTTPDGLWEGLTHGRPLDQPVTELRHLTVEVALKVKQLIDDTVDYVRWTLEWPRFVQIVRSIRQGDFIGDLAWRG